MDMSERLLEITPVVEIPVHLVGEVQSKLAYVDENIQRADVVSQGRLIRLVLLDTTNPETFAAIEEKTQRVVAALAKGAIRPKIEVLEDHLGRPTPFRADPMPELVARSQVVQEATGIFTLGPLVTRLVDFFEGCFLELAQVFGAQSYRFPTLIPASYLGRVNYFRAFPHSLTFATHLREDLDRIDHFAAHAACDEAGRLDTPLDHFSPIQTLLSPAVCYHLYFALADKTLPVGRLAATAVGNCFRYESTNLVSLERLWNFTMREVIFVGEKDYVLESREAARQHMQAVFEQIGLAYRVESATDPFFIGEFRRQSAFQSAFQLKYEIRARLPFKDSTLAVGSYNYHQDFFGRHLAITLPDGAPAHTGCAAFGLERMAFALLAQFGLEPQNWPAPLREVIP